MTARTEDVEGQLAELQRKYRIMEGNRKSYSEDSQKVIMHQRQTIEKLKEENQRLTAELELETKATSKPPTLAYQERLSRAQDAADQYTRKIELEKRKVEELSRAIEMCEAKFLEMRKMMGGLYSAKDNNMQVAKQVKVLENRLDKALVNFNEALANNKRLRDEIDSLRRERVVFDNIYKKMERELTEKKKEMANIIEVANIGFEARDQAQNEIAALKAQADKEQAAFEGEMRELAKLLEADRKAQEEKRKKQHAFGSMSMEEEAKLRKKVLRGAWSLAKEKANAHVAQEAVTSYEEAFEKIKHSTCISDIDELVTSFIEAEDANFSLFNYVNELNSEIERLEEHNVELNDEVARFMAQGSSGDSQRKVIIEDLEQRIEEAKEKAEQFDKKSESTQRVIGALSQGLGTIFTKLACSKDKLEEISAPSDPSWKHYMSLVEEKSNEVLNLFYAQQTRSGSAAAPRPDLETGVDDTKPLTVLGLGPMTPAGTSQINIDPPSTADDYVSDEDSDGDGEDRPFTRDELQAKTLRSLTKRGSSSQRRKKK